MRPIALILAVSFAGGPAAAQSWKEYAYPGDAFSVAFPADPKVETTTYQTADGRPAEARVYSVSQEGGVFRITVADLPDPATQETVEKRMHYVHQDGQAVFKFAVRKQAELCEKILTRNGLKGSDIDAFIPHQANKRIITATADRLNLRPESVIINIEQYGNTTAGTIPLAMETARQEGKLKKGSLVLLASVGAGFTVGATLLRWAY